MPLLSHTLKPKPSTVVTHLEPQLLSHFMLLLQSAEKLVRDRGGSCVARSYMSVSPVSRSGTSSLGTVVTTSLAQSFTTQPPPPKPSSSAPPGGHDEDGSDPTGARGTSPGVDCEDPLGSDHDFSRVFKKYDSLEKAIHRDSMDPLVRPSSCCSWLLLFMVVVVHGCCCSWLLLFMVVICGCCCFVLLLIICTYVHTYIRYM